MHSPTLLSTAGLCLLAAACTTSPRDTGNVDLEADMSLRSMAHTLARADAFQVQLHITSELGVDGGPVVEHSGDASVTVRRPDRLTSTRRGDLVNRDVWYDGEAVHVVDLDLPGYAIEPIPEGQRDLGAVTDYLAEKYGLVLPLADFLFEDPYEVLIENVWLGRHLGLRRMKDRACQHLAFRQPGVDWQIWIEAIDDPLPRKLVIKETGVDGEPEYSAEFLEWDLEAAPADDAFKFVPPDNMVEVSLARLLGVEDEG